MEREPNKSYDPRQWFSVSKLYEPGTAQKSADPRLNTAQKTADPRLNTAQKSANPRLNNKSMPYTNAVGQPNQSAGANQSGTYTQGNTNPSMKQSSTFTANPSSEVSQPDREKYDPQKLEYYISSLQNMVAPLSHEYKKSFPYDKILQLAHAVLDGTVFEIIKGLQDIQRITEQNLANRRTNLASEHKTSKSELVNRHQVEYSGVQNKAHKKVVIEKQHNEEKQVFTQRCEKELTSLDQKLVLELDRQASDQQATLQRAGLPFFFITNEPEDIKLQMFVLSFIIRLAATAT